MNAANPYARRSRFRILWPILLMVAILSVSSGGTPPSAPGWLSFSHSDKVVHFFVFGLIATLVYRTFPVWVKPRRAFLLAVVVTSLFGIADEVRQGFSATRHMDYVDWIADTAGAFVAVFVYTKWPFYRNLLETTFNVRKKRHGSRSGSSANRGIAPVNHPAR